MTANRIADAQKQLDTLIRTAYAKAFPDKEMRDFIIEIPKDTSHGDFASNAAMVNAKNAGEAPGHCRRPAGEHGLCRQLLCFGGNRQPRLPELPSGPELVLGCRAERAGLRCRLRPLDYGQGKKVMVEFVSANPTGPMHMGNARGGAIGDCLASALDFAGL